MRSRTLSLVSCSMLVFASAAIGAAGQQPSARPASATPAANAQVEHGKYLVTVSGCHDCHTTKKIGPQGPEPDMSLALAGHPEQMKMPAAPAVPPNSPWAISASPALTAWTGPWGISFAANLTPDRATGLGGWTEQMFITAMRTGKHPGTNAAILPPMPWQNLAAMTDADLKAIYAYLRSIPPIVNHVPRAVPPAHH